MEKRYNVFLEDVKCIEITEANLNYYKTVAERSGFYHPKKRANLNNKFERELSKLNNYKLNLVKKVSFIELSELLHILNETEGLTVKGFKCENQNKPDMELIVIIDNSQEMPYGIRRVKDRYYSDNEPAKSRATIFKAYSKLENAAVELFELQNINKGEIIKALISLDNDTLFENFLNSYINYLKNIFVGAGL